MVFKGTAVAQGTGRALVTVIGMGTQMGQVAALLDATAAEPTPREKEIAHIGRTLGIAVVVIAVVVVATILAVSDIRNAADVVHVLLLGVALAVAAVLEGLPAILRSCGRARAGRAAHGPAARDRQEPGVGRDAGLRLGHCSDKTGTLTRSEMSIERVMTASGETHVSGLGYAPEGRVASVENAGAELGAGPLRAENIVVLSGGSLAGNAELRQGAGGAWDIHGDPTEAAFDLQLR